MSSKAREERQRPAARRLGRSRRRGRRAPDPRLHGRRHRRRGRRPDGRPPSRATPCPWVEWWPTRTASRLQAWATTSPAGTRRCASPSPPPRCGRRIAELMDEIWETITFGIGRRNKEPVEHPLFDDDPAWSIDAAAGLRSLARGQLGTVGAGNHYVDVFADEEDRLWVGVHFGSRGLGHRLATPLHAPRGRVRRLPRAARALRRRTPGRGEEYRACMELAGRYAYAGRDWVLRACLRDPRVAGPGGGPTTTTTSPGSRSTTAASCGWCARGRPPPSPGSGASSAAPWAMSPSSWRGSTPRRAAMGYRSTVHGAGPRHVRAPQPPDASAGRRGRAAARGPWSSRRAGSAAA